MNGPLFDLVGAFLSWIIPIALLFYGSKKKIDAYESFWVIPFLWFMFSVLMTTIACVEYAKTLGGFVK